MMRSPPRPRAIFLHSGFRSGSTWFWHRFREAQGTLAYYEPFHELLASLTVEALPRYAPEQWASGHPSLGAPYFSEFRALLRPEGGVPFYQPRFAAEGYYETGTEAAQTLYIRSLVDHAQAAGKVPVFGFCRSLGRVPWFRALGEGVNIVTWRNPWDQWVSCRDQATVRQNWYFLFRFVLFASFGARHPRFKTFFGDLGLPPAPEGIATPQLAGLLAYLDAADLPTLFRIFLRVAMLDALIAVQHAEHLIDLDRVSTDAEHRRDAAAALREVTGLADLSIEDCVLPRHPGPEEGADGTLLEEALSFLQGAGAEIAREYPLALPRLAQALTESLRRPRRAVA
jgi:hypothetical protein